MTGIERITTSPAIRQGKPCIRGQRYLVTLILGLLGSGMTTEEIHDDFEDLELEEIRDCLRFATQTN